MKTINSIKIILAVLLVIVFTACGSVDNDDNNELPLGEINFTVTGEVEGTFSGVVDFAYYEDATPSQHWEIFGQATPLAFDVGFSLNSLLGVEAVRPEPGSYPIGYNPQIDGSLFIGEFYDHTGNRSYNTYEDEGYGGTITITTSNENTVEGSFTCTAARYDETGQNIVGTIEVSGEFTAYPRISQ